MSLTDHVICLESVFQSRGRKAFWVRNDSHKVLYTQLPKVIFLAHSFSKAIPLLTSLNVRDSSLYVNQMEMLTLLMLSTSLSHSLVTCSVYLINGFFSITVLISIYFRTETRVY